MGRYDRPKKRYTVRSEWFSLYPQRGQNMDFWASVAVRVRRQRVRHKDRLRIRQICCDVDANMKRQGR